MRKNILIIGCGEIGACLLNGWLNKKKQLQKEIDRIYILEKNKKRKVSLKKKYKKKIFFIENNKTKNFQIKFKYVFLAFKPNNLNSNLFLYKNFYDHNTIFYSLLAGKNISDIKPFFPIKRNIVRLMLNTPISVNKGTITYYSLKKLNLKELFLINLLGKVFNLNNENFFDLITAIVGSGPAFFYYLIETMEKKAVASGLKSHLSKQIIKNTYLGSAGIIDNLSLDISTLRKSVTSKGGTTEAAIKYLENNGFKKLINNSINQAIKKAKILRLKK